MSQKHPYNPDLSYHFANLALSAEVQPIWEVAEPDHADLENLFAIPRPYFDRIFVASRYSADDLYADIQGYIQDNYELIGVMRNGDAVISDWEEIDSSWSLSDVESMSQMWAIVNSYSRRFTETVTNTVRYSFSNLLMGYALRHTVDGHGIIVTRGTVSVEEWLNNMNYRLVPFLPDATDHGNVHNGFRDIYKGIRGAYRTLIAEIDADCDLYLVGHSLGAAVSQLAALDLSMANPDRAPHIHVYGYAPPRVGDADFAAAYDRQVATSYRVVNVCDVVPYVPFEELGTFIERPNHNYPYADTKGALAYVHQAGNPIANHIGSYHIATRDRIPQPMDVSHPISV